MLTAILIFALPKFTATFPVSPNGSTYIKQSEASTVLRMFDAKTGKVNRELSGSTFKPYVIQFSPDGTKVAASNMHGEVCLWVVDSGKLVFKLIDADSGRMTAYFPLLFSPDSRSLIVGNFRATRRTPPEIDADRDKTVISIWDTKTGKKSSEIQTTNDWPVARFMFVNKGRTLRVLSRSIEDFDFPSGKSEEKEWDWQFSAISDDGSLASEYSHWINVWDVASRKQVLHVSDTNPNPIDRFVFAPDNKSFAVLRKRNESNADTGYTLTSAELWSYPEGKLLWSTPEATHNMLCFSPDGSTVLLPNLHLRRVPSGELLGTFKDTQLPMLGKKEYWFIPRKP